MEKEKGSMTDILLTADKTLMSNYHDNEFLGFGTCAPPNFIPEWLFSYLFFPPLKAKKGIPTTAPYGLRKTEAQLKKEGFDVLTVTPDAVRNRLPDAKVLGVYTMDPFGLGPASSTLAALFKKEPYLAKHFEQLISNPAIKKAKQKGLKILVGGPGAWQFKYREKTVKDFEIDCVVEGETENIIGKLCKAAICGQEIPRFYETSAGEVPTIDEIPNITRPSINGLIEIGRGCCRGCQFCNVTLRPLRWYPIEKIEHEMAVNLNSGCVDEICLHAEDVMLYGSSNTVPNEEKLLSLHEKVMRKCGSLSWSHCSLAAVAANPKLFHDVSEIILQRQPFWGVEVGIETGSADIARKIMPAKAHPFNPDNWREVVVEAMGIMHDNKLVPAGTIIVGLPEEKQEDIIRTQELMDDLKCMRSLIVPLFFVPLGRLKGEDWFRETKLSKQHRELMIQCAEHDFYWVDNLLDWVFTGKWYSRVLREAYRGFASLARYKVRRIEYSAT